jgi:hypothetical protein
LTLFSPGKVSTVYGSDLGTHGFNQVWQNRAGAVRFGRTGLMLFFFVTVFCALAHIPAAFS